MKGATSIQERLWELRKDKGLNLEELSELTGISKSALGSYEKEDYKEINHGNLITLADFYGVSVDYLLCRTENREQINTPLTELHLNDEMVALLKSGRINNRLLCELATHKDFIKFLADIEIYVDGIATMQIQNLNALVDTVRHEIIERYRPGEDDPHLKVLQAAHISDDEYFSQMVRAGNTQGRRRLSRRNKNPATKGPSGRRSHVSGGQPHRKRLHARCGTIRGTNKNHYICTNALQRRLPGRQLIPHFCRKQRLPFPDDFPPG